MAVPRDRCACGEIKPEQFESCWRCIERDPIFILLDTLIAMGKGNQSRAKLSPYIIAIALANPRKPVSSDYRDAEHQRKSVPQRARMFPPCPECQSPKYAWRGKNRKSNSVYLRCIACGHRYLGELAPDSQISSFKSLIKGKASA